MTDRGRVGNGAGLTVRSEVSPMKLPHLTAARSKALVQLGITTESTMAEWAAARLAAAVNEINERTRTPASATAAWLTAAFHEPESVEPELDEIDGWETIGDFSVWFQQRPLEAFEGIVEERIRVVSHHDPTENHTEVWDGHEPDRVGPWMRDLIHEDRAPKPVVHDRPPGESDELDPRPDGVPTASTGDAAPSVVDVVATSPRAVVDLRPTDGRRPILRDRWQLEVRVDAPGPRPLAAELYLQSFAGDRIAVEATGDGTTLVSAPIDLTPGYHDARLHVRDRSTGELVEAVPIPTLYVRQPVSSVRSPE